MSLGNVLVIRPGALGDAVLTLPALAALHAAGAASLTVLGTPASWAFLRRDEGHPHVEDFGSREWLGLFADGAALSDRAFKVLKHTRTAILYLNGDTLAIARRLASLGVESIHAFTPPLASCRVDATEASSVVDLNWKNILPCHAARQLLDPLLHCISRNSMIDALDPARIERLGWLTPTREELDLAAQFRSSLDWTGRFFALHPGSGGRKKCWPAARFAELAARIFKKHKFFPIVFFGPADEETRREFSSAMPADVRWHPVESRPLREVVAVLHSCGFFIGNDSGMSHLAVRAGPAISIFGPTDPDVWAPIGRSTLIVNAPKGNLGDLGIESIDQAIETLTL